MTHYERLGVLPTASPEELRDAYRRAARAFHPDAHGDRSAAKMAEINLAWSVLRDPARRRVYDRTLNDHDVAGSSAGGSSTAGSSGARSAAGEHWAAAPSRSAEPTGHSLRATLEPARFPWRFMAVLAALGILVVMLGVVLSDPPVVPPPDNLLYPGSCVVFQSNDDAVEVNCTDPHDAIVEQLVAFDEPCTYPAEPHRDRQGRGIACVRRT